MVMKAFKIYLFYIRCFIYVCPGKQCNGENIVIYEVSKKKFDGHNLSERAKKLKLLQKIWKEDKDTKHQSETIKLK